MATKSVIEVDVQDGAFRRFSEMFAKYQDLLKKTPDAWKKVGDEVDTVLDKTVTGVEDVQAATSGVEKAAAGAAVSFRQTFINVSGHASAMQKVAVGQTAAGRAAHSQALAWREMARNSRAFATHITDATRSLLRWASLTGVISGVLGGGGLFGIDRLATSAGNSRRSALGLGVSPGEEKAFGLNYGRVVDSDRVLGGVNESLHDVTKRVSLYGAGLSEKDLAGKDTAQVSAELIPALKRLADQTPDAMMAQVMKSRHLDQFIDLQGFQRLKNTPAGEIAGYGKQYQTDIAALDLTKQQQKAWQDLQVQLNRAGQTIETMLTAKLTDLAPQIGHLSDAFTKAVGELLSNPHIGQWIDDLATGIKWLADYIGDGSFRTKIDGFITGVSNMGSAAGEVFMTLKSWIDWWKGATAADMAKKGGVNGPIQDDNPNAPGSPEWKKRQEEIARSHGVAPDDFSWMNPLTWGHQQSTGQLPRGVRNNNWLNLSYVPGQGASGSDGRFGVYNTPEEGIAASEKQLLRYQASGLDTIGKIISRWAPPGENDTAGYIADIAKQTGKDANARFDVSNRDNAAALIAAMARHETGRTIDPQVVQRGVGQALGPAPVAINQGGRAPNATITIHNNTGGSAVVSASQLVF